jgi:hypothetical protein
MAAFDKGHEKLGGRQKGTHRQQGDGRTERIAQSHGAGKRTGSPVEEKAGPQGSGMAMAGEEMAPPIKIDISAIPTHHVKA